MHLLIPFASSDAPGCRQVLPSLRLPYLDRLLRRLTLQHRDTASADSMSPPHERVLSRLHGMPAQDGCIAWAAHEVAQSGRDPGEAAWAWITPVHWDVGASHIAMADPGRLDLQEPESRSLLAAMRPFFEEDAITLEYAAPQRWLARGEVFGALASAALDRVSGREISAWMPSVGSLRRLQNEMQMLLYTHPVNDARLARGATTVNSFWVSGTGALPGAATRPPASEPLVADALRGAALRNDWALWAQRWTDVDARECRKLLESAQHGPSVQLTLCGERGALTFENTPVGLAQRVRRRFRTTSLQTLQEQL